MPALDKPIFFYWTIALAYKLFGISEWAARLPSALAALGCLLVLYRFVRDHWGVWEARWSILVLLTSLEFFLYTRIVIFDMTLTFLTTLALTEFYRAAHSDSASLRLHLIWLGIAVGLATLVKGPIGAALPGMVIVATLLIQRRWSFLSLRVLLTTALIYCAIVVPWAWWTENQHPGYLRYFLWEENFLRFFTPHFRRGEPWYYFLLVILGGFFPWSFLLPFALKDRWHTFFTKHNVFLILWITLPLLFFSLSKSKLPHYILPIFPALAVVMALYLKAVSEGAASHRRWALVIPWVMWLIIVGYTVIGAQWPPLLAREIRQSFTQLSEFQRAANFVVFTALLGLIYGTVKNRWTMPVVHVSHWLGMGLILWFVSNLAPAASQTRSAKKLSEHVTPFISTSTQLVFYDGYLNGLPFYLKVEKPLWVVWSGHSDIIMQNLYVAEQQPPAAGGFGQVLFTFDEFAKRWRANNESLLVFLKHKRLAILRAQLGDTFIEITRVGDYCLIMRR